MLLRVSHFCLSLCRYHNFFSTLNRHSTVLILARIRCYIPWRTSGICRKPEESRGDGGCLVSAVQTGYWNREGGCSALWNLSSRRDIHYPRIYSLAHFIRSFSIPIPLGRAGARRSLELHYPLGWDCVVCGCIIMDGRPSTSSHSIGNWAVQCSL